MLIAVTNRLAFLYANLLESALYISGWCENRGSNLICSHFCWYIPG